MANKIIGKVALTPKGNYNASTKYSILDVVTSGVDLYAAITDVPVGTPTSNTSYWQKLISGCSPSTEQIVQKGSYNLITFPYTNGTTTINGITFTVNSDGTVIANGTATATAIVTLKNYQFIDGKIYRISGCPSGGSENGYRMDISGVSIDTGNGNTFTRQANNNLDIRIRIGSGTTVNNLAFKPMLVEVAADGSYPTEYIRGSVYSNAELSEEVFNGAMISITQNGITYQIAKYGKICVLTASSGSLTEAVVNNGVLLTVPSGYIPKYAANGSDSISSKRIFAAAGGNVLNASGSSLASGTALRFTITYFCN